MLGSRNEAGGSGLYACYVPRERRRLRGNSTAYHLTNHQEGPLLSAAGLETVLNPQRRIAETYMEVGL
jgi:hypothetical protein